MTIYKIADILTGIIESGMMFMLCNTFLKKRETFSGYIYGIGIVVSAFLINLSNSIFGFGLNAVGMICTFFAMSFLFEGKLSVRAVISVLNYLLIAVIECMVLFGISSAFGLTVSEVIGSAGYRLFGLIVSKMLSMLTVNIIRIKAGRRAIRLGSSYWILFFIMFAISSMTIFLIFKLSYGIEETYMFNISVICSFGLLLSTFFALYLYEHLARQTEIIQNQKQYERHLKEQIKHLDEIVVTQNQIKKFKHDFLNYEIGLKSYLQNKDCVGAIKYLDGLSGNFGSSENIIETGNAALDAILSAKKAIAESKGISFTTQIQIPQKLDIEAIDMCIIFGNAVDNAIEACEKIKDKSRRIDLTLICQGKRVFCKITNTTAERRKSILKTSKSDAGNHGFGLDNIKTSLAKYNSEPTITQTDDEFTIKFIIFTK